MTREWSVLVWFEILDDFGGSISASGSVQYTSLSFVGVCNYVASSLFVKIIVLY